MYEGKSFTSIMMTVMYIAMCSAGADVVTVLEERLPKFQSYEI